MMLSIGDLSKKTGVKVVTIRYYEKIGLIEPTLRTEGNQRRYTTKQLERLAFVSHGRDLGFSLEDIRGLISLSLEQDKACSEAHGIAGQHLQWVRQRIASLKNLEKELRRITKLADGGHVGRCSIIESLADHQRCNAEH